MASSDAASRRWPLVAPGVTGVRPADRAPTFSVVIPVYGDASAVSQAVASALAQTAPPAEVIVVDDGSPADIGAALAEFGSPVRVVRVAHGGVSAARNEGARQARGEFVAFLDADDVYESDFLAAVGELGRVRPDLDVLTTDTRFVAGAAERETFYAANEFAVDDQRGEILRRCYLTMMSAVRRERLLEIGGFDSSLTQGEDWDFWLRLVITGSRIGLVDAPLSRYRMGPGQATARRAESLWGRVRVLDKALRSPYLTAAERATAQAALGDLRARAALATAATAGSGPAGRASWLRALAVTRGRRRWLRIALVGVVAPARATRLAEAAGVVSPWSPRRATPAAGRS